MTPEQLKASILQYAIQGKLVDQRPEEGNADTEIKNAILLKDKLNEDGVLKGRKNKELLTVGDDTPFDLPETWRWTRLGNIVEIFGRIGFRGYTKNDIVNKGEGAITMSPSNINPITGEIDFSDSTYLSWEKYEESPEIMLEIGDIVLVKTGSSYGKCGIIRELLEKSTINPQLAILKYISCDRHYLNWVLQCPLSKRQYEQFVTGTSIPTFSQEKLANMLIPLPPIEEQRRIVAKIEELLPYVNRYAESYEKLEQFNVKFPEDMKKSILQYAIQGKLVEQRPEEGTAEELYQRIQDERKKYKIKELSVEAIDDVPFDIPETWKWVHLQDIVKKTIKRGKSPKYTEKSEVQVFAQKCNVKTGGINMELALFLDEATIEKYPTEEYMCDGDIVINSTGGGTMGRVGVFHDTDRINDMAIVPDGHVTVIRACDSIDYKYLYYFIKHNQKFLETQGEGSTNQTELKPLTIASLVLPLPPLEEQHRIVSKIEEMLPYCDRLVK